MNPVKENSLFKSMKTQGKQDSNVLVVYVIVKLLLKRQAVEISLQQQYQVLGVTLGHIFNFF